MDDVGYFGGGNFKAVVLHTTTPVFLLYWSMLIIGFLCHILFLQSLEFMRWGCLPSYLALHIGVSLLNGNAVGPFQPD